MERRALGGANAPCLGCKERVVSAHRNCHNDCSRYLAFVASQREKAEEYRIAKDYDYMGYIHDRLAKRDRKARNKGGIGK